ncbi:MAG: glycosyltransferase family 39 protein [Anaerolineales bacterium]|nr:glycosyltransferase family 39 protein [Anaerolineales bacterium]
MKTQSLHKTRWGRLGDLLLPVLIALIFLAFVFSYYPFREKLQFDSDEGLNLMRSMLVTLGHPLYSEVSSDQPPLLTHLLALLFRIVGFEVNPARLLVLLFATLLVWSCAQFLQLAWGKLAAILFLPLVVMLPEYLRLSTSVMIGLPSIALAAASLAFVALWHHKRNNLWLALSGFVLALSVLIKLFTGLLVPVFLIGITAGVYFDSRDEGFSWKMLRLVLVWSICFAGLTILLGLVLVGPQNVWSIIFPHAAAPTTDWLQGEGYSINTRLQAAVPLLLLAALGALLAVHRRNWLSLYPLAWSVLAYASFSFYSPVFYHHQLLVTIPAALLAAAAVGEGILALLRLRHPSDLIRLQTILGVSALIGFVLVSSHYLPVLDKELMDSPRLSDFNLRATSGKLKVLRALNEHIDQTNWIVTDMPMYAFRVQRPVPPNLATFSSKRLATGALTDEDILAAMRAYQPEQVLMARFEIPALEAYLQENYTLILYVEYFRLFLRNDLMPASE